MKYQVAARADTKDNAKAALAEQFDKLSEASDHPIDWAVPLACANAMIDSLAENDKLDISVSVVGLVQYAADAFQHLNFSADVLLTDRIG